MVAQIGSTRRSTRNSPGVTASRPSFSVVRILGIAVLTLFHKAWKVRAAMSIFTLSRLMHGFYVITIKNNFVHRLVCFVLSP